MATIDQLKTEYAQKFPDKVPTTSTKKTITETKTVPNKILGIIPFGTKQVQTTRDMTTMEKLKSDYGSIFGQKEAAMATPATTPTQKIQVSQPVQPKNSDLVMRAPTPEEAKKMDNPSFWQKAKDFLLKPFEPYIKDEQTKDALAFQVSKNYNLDYNYTRKNFDEVARAISQQAGVPTYPTNRQYVEIMMTAPIIEGLGFAAIPTLVGLTTFAAGDKAVKEAMNVANSIVQKKQYKFGAVKEFSDLLPNDVSEFTRDMIDLLGFMGEAVLAHQAYKGAKENLPALKEKLTKDIITTYKLPKDVYLDSVKVRDIWQTGTKISPEETKMFTSLGLSNEQISEVVNSKSGISIKVPAEKIITITDKPYWAKLKSLIKLEPTSEVRILVEGKPVETVRGLLPGATETPIAPTNSIDQLKQEYKQKIEPTINQKISPKSSTPAIDLQKKINAGAESHLTLNNLNARVEKFGNPVDFENSFHPTEKTYIAEKASALAPKYILPDGQFDFQKFFVDKKSEFKQTKIFDKIGEVNPIKFIDNPQNQTEIELAEHQAKIMTGLDAAMKGESFRAGENSQNNQARWLSQKSSVPDYIPEQLRNTKLIRSVYSHIIDGTLPTTTDELRLYQIVSNVMNPEYGKQAIDEVNQEIDVNAMFGEPSAKELDSIEEKIDQQINEQKAIISSEQNDLSAKIEADNNAEKAGTQKQVSSEEYEKYRTKNLILKLQPVEKGAFDYAVSNKQKIINQYIEKFGNYFGGDNIKELLPGYAEDRTKFIAYRAAGNYLWRPVLDAVIEKYKNTGDNSVAVVIGAQGSGKTFAISEVENGKNAVGDSSFGWETTIANVDSFGKIIQGFIDKGFDIHIKSVYANPDVAFARQIVRAKKIERPVVVDGFVTAYNNVMRVNREWADTGTIAGNGITDIKNSDIVFELIDNTNSPKEIVDEGHGLQFIDFLDNLEYNKISEQKYYDKLKQLKSNGEIDEKLYKGFVGGYQTQNVGGKLEEVNTGSNTEHQQQVGFREEIAQHLKEKNQPLTGTEGGFNLPENSNLKLGDEVVYGGDVYKFMKTQPEGIRLKRNKDGFEIVLDKNEEKGMIPIIGNVDSATGKISFNKESVPKQKGLFGGSPASIGNYRDGTPIEVGHLEEVHPIELPEMVDLARELMGKVPIIKSPRFRPSLGGRPAGLFMPKGRGSIILNPEIFKGGAEQAAKTLSHEIGHLTDYLPEETLKRGNLLGRLLSLRKYMKDTFGLIDVKNSEIKKELKEVSKYWKPWDETKASPSFKNYRNSAVELYAEAVSVLFNSPGTLEKMAPKFYQEFFNNLDAKPEFKDNYFELQALLSGDKSTLLEHRRAGIQEMFSNADFKSADLQKIQQAERKERGRNLWASFKFALKSNNQPVYDKVAKLQKMGVNIPDDENPEILFSDRNYIGNQIKADLRENLQPIKETLDKNEIGWNSLGEVLMYDRIIAGDRSEVANPRGITPKHAQELLDALHIELGNEKFDVLIQSADKYRGWLKSWAQKAFEAGMINEQTYADLEKNEKYSPFQVIEHMDNSLSWRIKGQVGTLKDINNPANAGIIKTISTIRAIERQKMTKSLVKMLDTHFSNEIEESKYIFTGKGKRPIEPKDQRGLITFYENGALKGRYVDKYIAQSVERDSVGKNLAVMTMFAPLREISRKIIKPMFVVYNPGWIPFNAIRDFIRFWKNTPGLSMLGAMKRYVEASPVAKLKAFGLPENMSVKQTEALKTLETLEKEKILSFTYNDINSGLEGEDAQVEAIMQRYDLKEGQTSQGAGAFAKVAEISKKIIPPQIKWLAEKIRQVGDYVETLPKVAGYYELKTKMKPGEMRLFIRRNIGSPDFFEKGYLTPIVNDIFLFSNPIIQGTFADIGVATNPKTRSGFWWKTAKVNFLPKALMFAAILGVFGETIKKIMNGVSEYDRTNYTIIPLGIDDTTGKSIYLRIPQDETGRLFSGMFWKGITFYKFVEDKSALGVSKAIAQDTSEIASFAAGQAPNLNPMITSVLTGLNFVSGRNPYDSFRGKNIISDTAFKAGGIYKTKEFLVWQWNNLGGNIFKTFNVSSSPQDKQSPGEYILNFPIIGNIIGRFIKFSNMGESQALQQVSQQVQGEKAAQSLDEKAVINKYINKINKENIDAAGQRALENQVVKDILGHDPATGDERSRATSIKKKFRLSIKKGSTDPRIDALMYATSTDEKLALLGEMKKDMSQDYNNFLMDLRKEGVISIQVYVKAK